MSRPGLVIGVDPGQTTPPSVGVAVLPIVPVGANYKPEIGPHQVIQCDPISAVLIAAHIVTSQTPPGTYVVMAVEEFVVSHRAGRSGTPKAAQQARDLIGALHNELAGWVIFRRRTASLVKRWASDDRLKAAGLYAATAGVPHARDAARHALYAATWDLGLPDPLA